MVGFTCADDGRRGEGRRTTTCGAEKESSTAVLMKKMASPVKPDVRRIGDGGRRAEPNNRIPHEAPDPNGQMLT